ncbi:hypothetical protein QEK82_001554 [Stenotrophomonas maltophilia]|uniref:hypothetical protein n=1 Tax=Stenotrophomonas maltophilia group sp. Smal13 TaxID=3377166 RepID=UPI001312DBEE|nr:hypothetical protein [Stenotrophomonas maltophilia]EKU9957634.1 hypothetical protein [Stenotrophomonas maltophilia]EKU9984756.1 hypothetical protein [Stenotrophomonas maltophilia]
MSNDKTTLADARPGGRVRLGDQAERARFEAWAEERELDTAKCSADGMKGDYADLNTDWCWAAWQAALSAQPSPDHQQAVATVLRKGFNSGSLSWTDFGLRSDLPDGTSLYAAQPSPGGQGDASHYWPEVDRILVDAYVAGSEGDEFDMIAARNAIHTALAARQPSKQPDSVALGEATEFCTQKAARQPVGEPVAEVSRETFSSDGTSDIIKPNLPVGTKLYTAPPAQQPAQVYLDGLDRALGEAIDQRDRYHEVADDLAGHIAAITGVDIGEHSSANCPWQNAIEAAEEYKPAQVVDLGPVRAALDAAEGLAVVCASVDGYSREEVAASGRAMTQQFADARALIDSKAVGK